LAAVPGAGLEGARPELGARKLDKAILVQHDLLRSYTADGFVEALSQLIRKLEPAYVVFPHTYQVRDFGPKLATRFQQPVRADVVGVRVDGGAPVFVRQLMQGKLNADYVHAGNGPCFASVQAGAFRADTLPGGACSPEVFTPQLDASAIRVKPGEPF